MFCSVGIARKQTENLLPLLKVGDYDKDEKKKHSRSAARSELKKEAAKDRVLRQTTLEMAPTHSEKLLGSVLDLLALSHGKKEKKALSKEKDRLVRGMQKQLGHLEWRIDFHEKRGYNTDALVDKHSRLLIDITRLQEELQCEVEDASLKREADDTVQKARKVARTVLEEHDDRVIPTVINAISTIVSELGSSAVLPHMTTNTTTPLQKTVLFQTPSKDSPIVQAAEGSTVLTEKDITLTLNDSNDDADASIA